MVTNRTADRRWRHGHDMSRSNAERWGPLLAGPARPLHADPSHGSIRCRVVDLLGRSTPVWPESRTGSCTSWTTCSSRVFRSRSSWCGAGSSSRLVAGAADHPQYPWDAMRWPHVRTTSFLDLGRCHGLAVLMFLHNPGHTAGPLAGEPDVQPQMPGITRSTPCTAAAPGLPSPERHMARDQPRSGGRGVDLPEL